MTTAALAPRPAPSVARPVPFRRRGQKLAAVTLALAAFSIPVTGTGSALAAEHAPAHVKVAAITDSLVGLVATGKNDV